ncbi:NUDIX domain-containing protein [Lacticaseibacillus kribbianus]|uniref:NUDIX domain-containing protein n=1 Tax=Lacticaseibacillus kribbianus TaxID=2926292 RepID=UPI001CD4B565|nr:NUDIX hydrolase [Lacticaseibacillus kribbianus]
MEKIVASERLYTGRILELNRLTVRLQDGTTGYREVVHTNGAAGVLARRADGRVLFVRQWHTPLGQETLELPAGRIEPGESALHAAQRELNEEGGLAADTWQPLGRTYQAAGFSDASITLFAASGLHAPAAARSQDRGEFVTGTWLTLEAALAAQQAGTICDAKTVIGLLHWQLRR